MALCTTANGPSTEWAGDECAIMNCAVDAYFLRDIFNHMAFNHMNDSLSTDFGFDTSTCKNNQDRQLTDGTTQVPEFEFTTEMQDAETAMSVLGTTVMPGATHACCSSYPNRFPYKLKGGTRDCCVDRTFNTNLMECCTNGNVQLIGTC